MNINAGLSGLPHCRNISHKTQGDKIMKNQKQINQKSFIPGNGFIKNYQKLVKEVVIPYQYQVLNDSAQDNSEKSHVIQNFINAGNAIAGKGKGDGFYGMVFQDSDAAKWLEAVGFSLSLFPDKELEKTADALIDIIAAAQEKDGYLDTYFTLNEDNGKSRRWTNLLEGHELYCAGHMMEAACAYYESTGKKKLLDVMEKNAECIYKVFMEGSTFNKEAYPGHPEVELALMKMYRLTGNKNCFELARHFIDVRGVDSKHFEKECSQRDWTVWGSDGKNPAYNQAHLPVREQKDAKGHAVRAVYLYTGMADLASSIEDADLLSACKTLWKSITQKQMYITGGIGSTNQGEAFSVDYDLPSDTAYCETCASIGLIFFASRLLEMEVNNEYSDIMERAFYNTVLGGMQLDGKRFFYVNPLEVVPGIAGEAQTHRHDLPQRPTWYACACCPPNVARLVSSFGKYAYGENADTAYCHLYAAGKIDFANGIVLNCQTEYPYGYTVTYFVENAQKDSVIAIRIPGWSKKWSIEKVSAVSAVSASSYDSSASVTSVSFTELSPKNGYAYIPVEKGDKIILKLDSSPYFVYPSPKIPDLSGQVALCRGPFVYCAEGVDNGGDVLNLSFDVSKPVTEIDSSNVTAFNSAAPDGKKPVSEKYFALNVCGWREKILETLYTTDKPEKTLENIRMVPYYTWGNRGINQMKIWFPHN